MRTSRRRFLQRSAAASVLATTGGLGFAPPVQAQAAGAGTTWRLGEVLYQNPLASPSDVEGWVAEGGVHVTFPTGRMRLENSDPVSDGRAAHFLFWCPEDFPDDIAVSWRFLPIREPGLAMVFVGARGRNGEDLFDPSLALRDGIYPQYHSSDLDALHASYFRRRKPDERALHTVNLRKSHGFHLVAQGADPIPSVADVVVEDMYRIELVKAGPTVAFSVEGIELYRWTDDGTALDGTPTGPPHLGGGKLGFRQMAPLMAEYADLEVRAVEPG